MKPFDVVRVTRIRDDRYRQPEAGWQRAPASGDVGTIVGVHAGAFEVECVDPHSGHTVWLAAMYPDELAAVRGQAGSRLDGLALQADAATASRHAGADRDMIRFRHPKLLRQASGDLCIELTEAGTWESFPPPAFAEELVRQIGATIVERNDAPDVRIWAIRHQGHILRLAYDDHPNGVSVEPTMHGQDAVIRQLHAAFSAQASADGI